MPYIPEDYTEFFYWVKERTEAYWNHPPQPDSNLPTWQQGAKWIGMKDAEIDAVEKKYAIKFPPEHRLFLRILHTLDRPEVHEYREWIEVEDGQEESDEIKIWKRPFFFNWYEDDDAQIMLDEPFEPLLPEISKNKTWLKSWGEKPASYEEQLRIFSEWRERTPKVLPLYAHRSIVCAPTPDGYPVLSMHGMDIVVYGWNLKHYLFHEMGWHIASGILLLDGQQAFEQYSAEEIEMDARLRGDAINKDIPGWKEVMLRCTSGWSSFGMKAPL